MRLFGGTIGASSEAVDPDEKRRQERVRIAMQSLNEIPRGRLEFGRHMVVDTVTTEIYTVVRGEVDAQCSPADAFYIDAETHDPIFLERHAAPHSRRARGAAGGTAGGTGRADAAEGAAMTHTALIAVAPVTTLERINDASWKGRAPDRTMYDSGSLKFFPHIARPFRSSSITKTAARSAA